jgi:NagD protein
MKIPAKNSIMDMDDVLLRGRKLIPSADRLTNRLKQLEVEYLVLTNNPLYTPRDLAHRLKTIGIDILAERIFTSALATARFLQDQRPDGTAFVIGESEQTKTVHDVGYVITDHGPEYVVLGETNTYNDETITKAVRLIEGGA